MDTFNIMLQAHRGFAYLILLAALVFLVTLLMAMFGYSGKISNLLKKSTLFTMILFHLQAVIGIVMLFVFSPGFKAALQAGSLMSDSTARFTYVEHPFSMIVGAVLMTIINKKIKSSERLSLNIVIMGVVAFLLFAYGFPWARLFGN